MNKNDISKKNEKFNKLVKSLACGERNAFENFYNAYGKLIYSAAINKTRNKFLADEIVNDVLVKVWQYAKNSEDNNYTLGWLYKVTGNCTIDKIKRERTLYEIYDIPQEDININKFIEDDMFYSYLTSLDEDEQQIIIMRVIQDLKFKTIAKVINKPESTVSSVYYRAVRKLRLKLEKS